MPDECRVLGVLVEKAQTVASQYPITLNALVNACNQKSNREPVVNYEEEVVQQALALLRHKGLALRISGAGHRISSHSGAARSARRTFVFGVPQNCDTGVV